MNAIPVEKMDRVTLEQIGSINRAELKKGLDALLARYPSASKVLLISPIVEDYQFIRAHYPQFDLYITQIGDWNLDQPCTLKLGTFDVAIASNVMMYSRHPQTWVDHVLAVARHFVFQDVVYRKRSAAHPHLGTDQDAVRYCLTARSVTTSFPTPFDLDQLTQKLFYFASYKGGLNSFHSPQDPPVHLVAVVESDHPDHFQIEEASHWRKLIFKMRNLAFSSEPVNKLYRNVLKFFR
jgi:hypothetical protein